MRNVRFNKDVVQAIRKAARDYAHNETFVSMLRKIYQSGYDNGLQESTNKIREVLNDHQSTNPSHNVDGEQLQPDGSVLGASGRPSTNDTDSSEGSAESDAFDEAIYGTNRPDEP